MTKKIKAADLYLCICCHRIAIYGHVCNCIHAKHLPAMHDRDYPFVNLENGKCNTSMRYNAGKAGVDQFE